DRRACLVLKIDLGSRDIANAVEVVACVDGEGRRACRPYHLAQFIVFGRGKKAVVGKIKKLRTKRLHDPSELITLHAFFYVEAARINRGGFQKSFEQPVGGCRISVESRQAARGNDPHDPSLVVIFGESRFDGRRKCSVRQDGRWQFDHVEEEMLKTAAGSIRI